MEFIPAKTILSGYTDNDFWFAENYNMNIYRGCCHGCIYCDSRSECYHVDNFDQVRAKENALALLYRDIKSKRKKGVIGTGAMSDPYNPFEKELELTRGALELINNFGFGIGIATKSPLIARDVDLFRKIREHSPVIVKITVTACNDELSRKIEANVAAASERFAAIKKLSENGIFTGLLMMPVLPFIEDNEENIMGIIRLAHENGARFIYPSFGVTLRQNQREWYFDKLDQFFPGMKQKYIKEFGNVYSCKSPNAEHIKAMFKNECEKLGLLYKMKDIVEAYRQGYENRQLSLL